LKDKYMQQFRQKYFNSPSNFVWRNLKKWNVFSFKITLNNLNSCLEKWTSN
jgi:hypothetical protein